jgi:hypothetical protein
MEGRDSVAVNDNFFADLQKHNFGEELNADGTPVKMRGLTKIG